MCTYTYHVRLVVIAAQDLADVSTLGKLDAFARVYYQDSDYKTSVIHDCGKNPIWNYELSLSGNCNNMKIVVFDHRLLKEKYIGECTIDYDRIPAGDHKFIIPLTDNGVKKESLGSIRVNICLQKTDNHCCEISKESMTEYTALPCQYYNSCPVLRFIDPSIPIFPVSRSVPNISTNIYLPQVVTGHDGTPLVALRNDQSFLLRSNPHLLRNSSMQKSSSQNSFNSYGDSPYCQYKEKTSHPNHGVNYGRRQMPNNAKFYPIIPSKK